MTYKTEMAPLAALKLDPNNARTHDEKNLKAIKGSLKKFKQQKPLVVDGDGIIIAGNGTYVAAKALGWTELAVHRTELKGDDAKAYALADNRSSELAEWDDKVLGETLQYLREMDFDIESIGFDLDEFGEDSEDADSDYTKKIEAPIYEPTGEKPPVTSLVDLSKSEKLIEKISAAKIPDDIKTFLRYAAARHNVFDYQKIAEFYAHASADIQDLMEESALVIIDFNRAIEEGFVKLTKEIAESYLK